MDFKDGVSFKFSKKTEKKTLEKSRLENIDKDKEEEEKFYITDYNKDDFKKSKETKLAIPLIKENKWRNCNQETNGCVDDLTKEAVKELLQDPASITSNMSKLSIPILVLNKVPEETEDHPNFSARPEMDEADFEDVPIEEFGYAMLRGMGWKDGDNKTPIIEPGLRPKCLGLTEKMKKDGSRAEFKREEEEEKELGPHCVFVAGTNIGKYGIVLSDSAERLVVEMAISKEKVNTNSCSVRMISKKEYDKNQRYLNNSKVEEYTRKEAEKFSRVDEAEKKKHSDKKKKKEKRSISRERSRSSEDKNVKKRKREAEEHDSHEVKTKIHISSADHNIHHTSGKKAKEEPWLHPHLIVRIIDKNFKKGKYYKEKVIIEDVTEPLVCVCRTSDDRLLEDLHQNMLETVIPREVPSFIMVVKGQYKFQVARMLHKEKDKCRVMVSLVKDEGHALTFDFDDVCQYSKSDL